MRINDRLLLGNSQTIIERDHTTTRLPVGFCQTPLTPLNSASVDRGAQVERPVQGVAGGAGLHGRGEPDLWGAQRGGWVWPSAGAGGWGPYGGVAGPRTPHSLI